MSDHESSLPADVTRYLALRATAPADDHSVDEVRFVSLDCETTGTDAKKDRIITMGAITVKAGEILLEDQFEAMLHVSHNTSSVLVHGITAEEAAEAGVTEPEALRGFLDYLGNAVIVGHHIGFDVEVIQHACQRSFGIDFPNHWIDTMEVTLHLEDAGVFEAIATAAGVTLPPFQDFSLDGLCQQFHIDPHDRHTASGDAFITAQIFLKLLRLAKHQGRITLGALAERYIDPRATE
ncbi:MAG: 3'-5' exonuclease [Verrucomicrobiia bacterium]|tara:strand:- start:1431 stop:2141 length:711 start_codon:yes stop_codon:yes gene_type:complete